MFAQSGFIHLMLHELKPLENVSAKKIFDAGRLKVEFIIN
jgi:hypothetical protein